MTCPVCGATSDEPAESCPACGADLLPLAPGAVVAERYEVKELLGRGGMGAVYRASDRVLHEEVALKVQRADAARDPAAERRFRNEVKLARQVSHPNVCRLHDGGREGPRRWISMELVLGQTVAARLREGPLAADEAWSLAVQAADGLAAVHRAGVVHRDLKALNLMVDAQGRLRLMDFGIAKPAASGDTGASGYAIGSPEYMSPEQARGRPADARSDVYSLGIVIFELFTGTVPFRAPTPVATLLQHLEAEPPLQLLPEALRPLLARALAKNPAERWADGEAMAGAVRAAREGRLEALESKRVATRWKAILAVPAAAAVVAIVAVTWSRAPQAAPEVAPSPGAASPPGVVVPKTPGSPPATSATAAPGSSGRGAPALSASPSWRDRASAPLTIPEAPATIPEGDRASAPTPMPSEAPSLGSDDAPAPPPPTPAPSAPPSPAASPTPQEDGALLVVVRPWADVSVDGIPRGQTPLGRIPLAPGRHNVLLTHPDYRPFPRRVTIQTGKTLRLVVDLPTEGVPR